jgi:hypothetical protein
MLHLDSVPDVDLRVVWEVVRRCSIMQAARLGYTTWWRLESLRGNRERKGCLTGLSQNRGFSTGREAAFTTQCTVFSCRE